MGEANGSYASEEEAIQAMIKNGWASEDQTGKVINTDVGEFIVYQDAKTRFLYTFNTSEKEYHFEGKTFDSYDKLVNYLTFEDLKGGRESVPDGDKETVTYD
jgi:hypothetical protein